MYCHICKEETENNPKTFTLKHLRIYHKDYTAKKYYDTFLKKENEDVCMYCGKIKKFLSISEGYIKTCSDIKCRYKNYNIGDKISKTMNESGIAISRVRKIKATKLKRYGDENYNNIEKHKETCLDKYGVDSHFKNKKIKEKIEQICLDKYGVKYNLQNKDIHKKTKKTMEDLYGGYGLQSKEILEKTRKEKRKNEIEELRKFLNNKNYTLKKYISSTLYLECDKGHSFEINRILFNYRVDNNKVLCTNCNPIGVMYSCNEKEVTEFIKRNYNGYIEENNKKILNRKELDVYIPDLNLAFEFNGVYWHSELYRDNDYHLNKTKKCLEKNIQLIHIYEDDWIYKNEIVKDKILKLLGKYKEIDVNECTIKEVNDKESRIFLDDNHIKGSINCKYNIGLYYNNELYMSFSFSKLKNKKTELLRICNKKGYTIIGGEYKLLKYFLKNNDVQTVVTYVDRSWSNGNLYKKLGFNFVKEIKPDYYYIQNNLRLNKNKFSKFNLIKEGFDENKTEKEIMFGRGIYRIYDSGYLEYIYRL